MGEAYRNYRPENPDRFQNEGEGGEVAVNRTNRNKSTNSIYRVNTLGRKPQNLFMVFVKRRLWLISTDGLMIKGINPTHAKGEDKQISKPHDATSDAVI